MKALYKRSSLKNGEKLGVYLHGLKPTFPSRRQIKKENPLIQYSTLSLGFTGFDKGKVTPFCQPLSLETSLIPATPLKVLLGSLKKPFSPICARSSTKQEPFSPICAHSSTKQQQYSLSERAHWKAFNVVRKA